MRKLSNLDLQALCLACAEALKKSKPWPLLSLPDVHRHLSKGARRRFIYLSTFFGVVLSKKHLLPSSLKTNEKVDPAFLPGRSGTYSSLWEAVGYILAQWCNTVFPLGIFFQVSPPSPFGCIISSSFYALPQLSFLLLPSTLHTSTCCTTPVSFSFSAGHSYTYRLVWDDPASSTIPYCGQNRAIIAPEALNHIQPALVSTCWGTRNKQPIWQLWEHAVYFLFSAGLQCKVSIKGYKSREAAKLGRITKKMICVSVFTMKL